MDKLQWFKFTPSDWMMGKIQRCPEITQARFMRLCCLYWNKDCVLSIEDAEIEIDKEHFEILVAKKIVSLNDTHFNISFLDEQYLEIQEDTKDKSKSGIIGNLKRWHPLIYNEFVSKKISLEQAIKKSKSIAEQSHPDNNPIAEQSQNIADKTRQDEDKIRKDKKRKDLPTKVGLPKINDKSLYTLCVEAWFENWSDYVFSKVDGSKMKNIIKQLKTFAKRNNIEPTDEEILNYWKIIINKMPKFYQGKDLKTVDSKLNEIVNEIKTNKNERNKQSKYAN